MLEDALAAVRRKLCAGGGLDLGVSRNDSAAFILVNNETTYTYATLSHGPVAFELSRLLRAAGVERRRTRWRSS